MPVTAGAAPGVEVAGIDADGLRLRCPAEADVVVDVLLDDQRVWSFWSLRDTEPGARRERLAPWPRPLTKYLDGHTRVEVREHVSGATLLSEEHAFGTGTGRIAVVDEQGKPLGMDKSGRLTATFETRSTAQFGPLLDSIERVLAALHAAGVEAFPAYGTLLGAVRDGGFIGHDSDADLGYVSRHGTPVDVVLESFALQRRLAAMGLQIVRYSGAAFKVLVTEPDGNVRGLDVFGGFVDEAPDGEPHLVLMGEIRVPFRREWVLPLGSTTLEDRTLPAPADTDRFLQATYGPGWRTPDPAFRFETPASTSRRLDDWFRGTSVNRPDWDRRYQLARHRDPAAKPGRLPRLVLRGRRPDLVVDVGCGRGAATRWIARQGVPAIGLDFSARAFEHLAAPEQRAGLPLSFAAMNLLELRHVLGWGTRLARTPGRRHVLARHVADAVPRTGQDHLWRFAQLVCGDGGRLFLEFLVSDAEGDPWAERNLLHALDPDEVAAALAARGGRVLRRRSIGTQQMQVRLSDDPAAARRRACRMVVAFDHDLGSDLTTTDDAARGRGRTGSR